MALCAKQNTFFPADDAQNLGTVKDLD